MGACFRIVDMSTLVLILTITMCSATPLKPSLTFPDSPSRTIKCKFPGPRCRLQRMVRHRSRGRAFNFYEKNYHTASGELIEMRNGFHPLLILSSLDSNSISSFLATSPGSSFRPRSWAAAMNSGGRDSAANPT